MTTLQQHISRLVHDVLDRYPGSWMTWCDPRGDWGPLLQRVAELDGSQGFTLVSVTEQTAGEIGSPTSRRALQERMDAKESFVLHVTTTSDNLGWLWAQALLSECIYDRSLREQLLTWGWRPQSVKTGDDEVAVLARQYLKQDPAEWGGGGLQPNPVLLLDVLAGGATPDPDDRMVLEMTIEQAGLPAYDEQNVARWRTYALVGLLVTQAYQVAPDVVGEGHSYLIAPEKRVFALSLLERWLDSLSLSKGLTMRSWKQTVLRPWGTIWARRRSNTVHFSPMRRNAPSLPIRALTWHNRAGESFSRHSPRSTMMCNVTHKGSGTTRIATLTRSPFPGAS